MLSQEAVPRPSTHPTRGAESHGFKAVISEKEIVSYNSTLSKFLLLVLFKLRQFLF